MLLTRVFFSVIFAILPTNQAEPLNLHFYNDFMDFCKIQHPVVVMRNMFDVELGQVAETVSTRLAFLNYETREESKRVVESLMSLKALGEVDMVLLLGRGHYELLNILLHELKLFNSGCVVAVLPQSEYLNLNPILNLTTKLYYFSTQQDGSVDLMESYAVNGIPIKKAVGSWDKSKGLTIPTPNIWDRRTDLSGQTIRVTSKTFIGLSFLKYDGSNKSVIGGGGYFIEPVYYLAKKLNFTPKFLASIDDKWGGKDINGTWNGMVGMLVKDEADIIAAGLTRLQERDSELTFSITLLEDRPTLIAPMSKQLSLNIWAYLELFTTPSWVVCGSMVTAIGIAFTIINAYGTNNLHDSDDSENFNIINGMGVSMLMLVQLSYNISARNISSRILLFASGLGFYLIFAHFAADLTGSMILGPKKASIGSFDDVLRGGYKVIVTESTSHHEILKTATPGTAMHQVYYETMEGEPESFVQSSKVGKDIILDKEKTLMFSSQFRAMQDDTLQALNIQVQFTN